MARYYDADWLVDDIKLKDHVPLEDEDAWVVIDWLENFPTVDIVKCKECKHYEEIGCLTSDPPKPIWGCHLTKQEMTDDDFCSRGERRYEVTE